jgi:hypothetical protein
MFLTALEFFALFEFLLLLLRACQTSYFWDLYLGPQFLSTVFLKLSSAGITMF